MWTPVSSSYGAGALWVSSVTIPLLSTWLSAWLPASLALSQKSFFSISLDSTDYSALLMPTRGLLFVIKILTS